MRNKMSTKKKLIILAIMVFLIAVILLGIFLYIRYRQDSLRIEVIPVEQVSTYYSEDYYSQGIVSNNYTQEIRPDSSQTISEVLVSKGDEVTVGTPLLRYDSTKLDLDVQTATLNLQKTQYSLGVAQNQLARLQRTTPASNSASGPIQIITPRPTYIPTYPPLVTAPPTPGGSETSETSEPSEPEPSPTANSSQPVSPSTAELYSSVDIDSVPYAGTGSSDDPYIYLCTEDAVLTPDFVKKLMGIIPGEPTPAPDGTTPADPTGPGPFAAVFEVRSGNSNFGDLIYGWKLDGNMLSSGFILPDSTESIAEIVDSAREYYASPAPTPTPMVTPAVTPYVGTSSGNYNSEGYTAHELTVLIAEKHAEISQLETDVKQMQLNLTKAELALSNATVLSEIDGVVSSLSDAETAVAENIPLMVVSGSEDYYLLGAISESLLGTMNIGDIVTANNYTDGNSYTVEITGISDFPSTGSYSYSADSNPNSSNYEFTGRISEPGNLKNGDYLEIVITPLSGDDTESVYLSKAYVREDTGGSYVLKQGEDNRLQKQYVTTGRTVYNEYVEVKSGLSIGDSIAFPYDINAVEGVRIKGADEEQSSDGQSSDDESESFEEAGTEDENIALNTRNGGDGNA